ncbi:hypothetical protein NX779_03040 [Mycoplasma cottewii]|uniref:Uncharacterized protein n=1 Tax=Mycoplasma cottewii TaxID=51364 RepID=A0ABY5TYT5_9MOLU|nr:hypothetical protein [Mycoplasma cottewii]UWD34766.1 hypothetical protein NX779_03040 [Mycoplasma cottewii]
MKHIEDKDLYWITQYASVHISDQGVYEIINNAISRSNPDDQQEIANQIINLVGNMEKLDNSVNQKIYDKLESSSSYSLEELEKTNEFFENIDGKKDIDDLEEIATDSRLCSFADFLEKNEIESSDSLEEIINDSLKNDGLDSRYINLVEPWRNSRAEYVIVNGYINGFTKEYFEHEYKLENEYKQYLIDEFIDDLNLKDTLTYSNSNTLKM